MCVGFVNKLFVVGGGGEGMEGKREGMYFLIKYICYVWCIYSWFVCGEIDEWDCRWCV